MWPCSCHWLLRVYTAGSLTSPALLVHLSQVRKDHWKGMSPAQLAGIKQQQAAQLEAKKAAEAAAAAAEAQAAAHSRSVQRAVLLQAQAAEQARRAQAAAVAATLKNQIAAKAAKDAQVNQLYANKVGAAGCSCHLSQAVFAVMLRLGASLVGPKKLVACEKFTCRLAGSFVTKVARCMPICRQGSLLWLPTLDRVCASCMHKLAVASCMLTHGHCFVVLQVTDDYFSQFGTSAR
jgi:hypothetical protein